MSFAFPRTARESASYTAHELYQSAVQQDALEQQQQKQAPSIAQPVAPQQQAVDPAHAIKISKRTNARLQLAAALIEADNDRIYEKAEYWHLSHPHQGSEVPRPPPPPQPALASQSAIFAPFRDGIDPTPTRHVRTWSGATGLSQILTPRDEGQRPSIDFLGIALPNEQRRSMGERSSRADSLMSSSRRSVATERSGSLSQLAQIGESTLTDWNIDKFLSKEERDRNAIGRTSRANSIAAPQTGEDRRRSLGSRSVSASPGAAAQVERATSEIIASSQPTNSKLDLLAKIKLYRERQENLSPSQWDGPGPQASRDQVIDHLMYDALTPVAASINQFAKGPFSRTDSGSSAAQVQASEINPAASADRSTAHESTPIAVSGIFEHQRTISTETTHRRNSASAEMGGIWSDENTPQIINAQENDFFSSQLARTLNKGAFSLATPQQLSQAQLSTSQPDGAVENVNMVGIGSYSRSQSRHGSVMGSPLFSSTPLPELGRSPSENPFHEVEMGLGPSPFAAAVHAASPRFTSADHLAVPLDTGGLTTRQLQTMARNSTFPSHLGINRDLLEDLAYEQFEEENEFGQLPKPKPNRFSLDVTALTDDLAKTGGANFQIRLGGDAPPDLSSANWGKPRKKWFRLSTMADAKGRVKKPTKPHESDFESDAEVLESAPPAAKPELLSFASRDALHEVDDDYISPPSKGPLRPLGLSIRLPQTLVMPSRLEGTDFAPKLKLAQEGVVAKKRHSLHVPDGFILHDARGGLPPMRSLVVQSASGPQALFAAKGGSKKHQQIVTDLKAIEVGRTVQVPAAAPRGIGRRAAAPTTALFRNQLVQHEDEREGWGWEAGTRASDTFTPDVGESSDDDDKPLADLKKQGRTSKKAAKRLAKEKRKRKEARRLRRAKREEALRDGISYSELPLADLSPDEDLDLSSTTSEEDVIESGSQSDIWASDDDKRWVDDQKPAGKLYGKSLLDIATERTIERKSKARFYGQVQLEDDESTMLQLDDATTAGANGGFDDGASIAPSVAKSFRDKPLGYNDTRERMEAVFGADQLWARELAKRKEDEAAEATLVQAALAEELAKPSKKEKGLFTRNKKKASVYDEAAAGSSVSLNNVGTAVSESAPEALDEAQEVPERIMTEVQPPTLALDLDHEAGDETIQGKPQKSTLLRGEDQAINEWMIPSEHNSVHEDSDEDDDVPLSQIRKRVALRPSSFAAGLGVAARETGGSSPDEEMPLAALKEKRARQSMMIGSGALDLDFTSASGAKDSPVITTSPVRSHLDSPHSVNQVVSTLSRDASAPNIVESADTSDSEDDLPLGQRHPGGTTALAAIRVAMEQKKVAARESKRLSRVAERLAARRASGSQADRDSQFDSESDDSEDDKPLGHSHPQAAIIAEQAALIRQLQAEQNANRSPTGSAFLPHRPTSNMMTMNQNHSALFNMSGDQRQSMMMGFPSGMGSMIGLSQYDGLPASSMGMPPQMRMSMSSPMNMVPSPGSQFDFGNGMSSPSVPLPTMAMSPPSVSAQSNVMSMLVDPKASSIHSWRTQVPLDAPVNHTPSSGASAIDL